MCGVAYLKNILVVPQEVFVLSKTQSTTWEAESGRGVGEGEFPPTEGESVQRVNELHKISGEAKRAAKVELVSGGRW